MNVREEKQKEGNKKTPQALIADFKKKKKSGFKTALFLFGLTHSLSFKIIMFKPVERSHPCDKIGTAEKITHQGHIAATRSMHTMTASRRLSAIFRVRKIDAALDG